jgi:hypothetical protein
MHGLAGSGTLTALVIVALPSTVARLAYLALFGLGSTIGMAVLSGLLGWPLTRFGQDSARLRAVSFGVGCVSILLGWSWGHSAVGRLLGSYSNAGAG